MNTFSKLWGVVTPKEAQEKIEEQKSEYNITDPKNLEEQAISLVGKDIYLKLENADIELGVDYLKNKEEYDQKADKVLFTGMIDEYFNYKYGNLEYRSLKFENEIYEDIDNYQGNAVVNYTSHDQKYTRIIEHKHFEFNKCKGTVITKEYPMDWKPGDEAYYPVNDEKNNTLFEKYKELAQKETNVIFGGRLGNYKYYDMDKVIKASLELANSELK